MVLSKGEPKGEHLEYILPYRKRWLPFRLNRLFYDPFYGVFTDAENGESEGYAGSITILKAQLCYGWLFLGSARRYQWVPYEPCEWLQVWLLPTEYTFFPSNGTIYVMYLMGKTKDEALSMFKTASAVKDIRQMVWGMTPYYLFENEKTNCKYDSENYSLLWSYDCCPSGEARDQIEFLEKHNWFTDELSDYVISGFEILSVIC